MFTLCKCLLSLNERDLFAIQCSSINNRNCVNDLGDHFIEDHCTS